MEIKFPAVSIIIPMYNAEKYIGECLNSILVQTFTDYEIIIVDDCSTDNSLELVKSYIPKFGGRLIIAQLNNNSGNAAMPRNVGIELSHGEYLFFVDSDDALTPTALSELYPIAKKFDAEILYYNGYYKFIGENLADSKKTVRNFLGNIKTPKMLENPLNTFLNGGLNVMPWCYLFRRNLIIENKLTFPNMLIGEDRFFVYSAMFFAKKVVRVPNACYYYRKHAESISTRKISDEKLFTKRVEVAMSSINFLEDFFAKHAEFFQDNPDIKYLTYNKFANGLLDPIVEQALSKKIPIQKKLDITCSALDLVDDKKYLTAFFINKVLELRISWRKKNNELKKLKSSLKI